MGLGPFWPGWVVVDDEVDGGYVNMTGNIDFRLHSHQLPDIKDMNMVSDCVLVGVELRP